MREKSSTSLLRKHTAAVILFFFWVCLFLLLEWRIAGALGFFLDDGWIFSQYARNLVEGKGFCFNEGELSNGFTSLLWLLLIAFTYQLTGEFVIPMKVMGILFGAGAVILAQQIALRLTEDDERAKLAGLITASFPFFVAGSVSGMEIGLYVFTGLLGFWWHLRVRIKPSASWAFEGVIWGLAILSRPENAVLWLITFADKMRKGLACSTERFTVLKWLAWQIGLVTVFVSPWVILNFIATGTPFPTTYLAKVVPCQQTVAEQEGFIWGRVKALSLVGWEIALFVVSVNPILVAYLLWNQSLKYLKRSGEGFRLNFLVIAALLFFALRALNYPAAHILIWRAFGRYSPPGFVLLLIGLALNLRPYSLLRLAVVVGFLPMFLFVVKQNVHSVRFVYDTNVEAARWINAHLPPGEPIATHDIGAIGFFTRRRVFDTQGLIHPEITPYLRQLLPYSDLDVQWIADDKLLREMHKRRICYLVAIPEVFPILIRRKDLFEPLVLLPDYAVREGKRFIGIYRIRWECSK